MKKLKQEKDIKKISKYKYGFNEGETSILKLNKGLNQEIIKEISLIKKEPE